MLRLVWSPCIDASDTGQGHSSILTALHPDWLGSPQHVVGGLALAAAVVFLAKRLGIHRGWLSVMLAVGVTMTVESIVEVAEYPVLYSGSLDASAYYDTIADIASTLVGAALGALGALAVFRRR